MNRTTPPDVKTLVEKAMEKLPEDATAYQRIAKGLQIVRCWIGGIFYQDKRMI